MSESARRSDARPPSSAPVPDAPARMHEAAGSAGADSHGRRFSRAFAALVVAQVISLMGDRIVCFALPLYVLGLTGSSSLYSVVTAAALVPYIVLTPIGGVVADRVDKRRLMAGLDLALAAVCVVFLLVEGAFNLVALCSCAMVALYAVQGFYAPAVQATVPTVVARDGMVTAVALTNQVSSLAGLAGPFVGGMLYGFFGLEPILLVGAGAFVASSAIVATFVRAPQRTDEAARAPFADDGAAGGTGCGVAEGAGCGVACGAEGAPGRIAGPECACGPQGQPANLGAARSARGPLAVVRTDVAEALRYLRGQRFVVRVVAYAAVCNLVMSAFITIFTPVAVTQMLGLSSQLMGVAEAAAGLGSLAGGIVAGVAGSRLRIAHAPLGLVLAALVLVPVAAAFGLGLPPLVCYGTMVACLFLCLAGCQLCTVQFMSYIQLTTPRHLIGKVIALTISLCMVALPAGQLVWGFLLDAFRGQAALLVLAVSAAGLALALSVWHASRGVPDPEAGPVNG